MEEYVDELKALPLVELMKEMARVKDELEKLKKAKTNYQKLFDVLRLNIIPEKMEEDGISTTTIPEVGRVSLQSDLYFSIPADQREDAYNWLKEHGHGDIIKPTVNASTGKRWAKDMMKAGEQLPEGLFKVTPFTRATLTKVKK